MNAITDPIKTGQATNPVSKGSRRGERWRMWIPFLLRSILSVAWIAGGVAVFLALGASDPPQPKSAANSDRPVVETASVAAHEDGIKIEVDGVVVPLREISIAAEVSGRVHFKAEDCRIGRFVKQGDLLIRIDPRDYEFEIQRLGQELEQAVGSLEELDADRASNKNEIVLDRDEVIIRRRELRRFTVITDPVVFSKTEVDAAKRNELVARSALQASIDKSTTLASRRRRLEGAREIVKSKLAQAKVDLDRTEIHAPISGIVTQEQVEQDGFAQTGVTLIAIQDTENIEVKCSLHARQEQWLWMAERPSSRRSVAEGQASQSSGAVSSLGETRLRDVARAYEIPPAPTTVSYSYGHQQWTWQGRLTRYDGSGFDEQTRMVPVRVRVDDPLSGSAATEDTTAARRPAFRRKTAQPTRSIPPEGGTTNTSPHRKQRALKTGMFVKVKMRILPSAKLIRLPQAAVRPGNVVWTVHDGELQRVQVEPLHATQGQVLLFQDKTSLRPGDPIVVSPLPNPANGQAVAVVERAAP